MRSHDGRVDHQILVLLVADQLGEDTLPDPGPRPAHEPRMHALVLAIALRQIVPPGSRSQHPQNSIDELPVIRRRSANVLHPTRKRVFDPLPLHLAQLIPTRHISTASATAKLEKSICGYCLARNKMGAPHLAFEMWVV